MRIRKRMLFALLIALAVTSATLVGLCYRPLGLCVISIDLLGYTNRSGRLFADLAITNQGKVSASYDGFLDLPVHVLRVQTPVGWTNFHHGPRTYSRFLEPGSGQHLRIELPLDAVRWGIIMRVGSASVRERAEAEVEGYRRWRSLGSYFLRCGLKVLPNRRVHERDVESPLFQVAEPGAAGRSADKERISRRRAARSWRCCNLASVARCSPRLILHVIKRYG